MGFFLLCAISGVVFLFRRQYLQCQAILDLIRRLDDFERHAGPSDSRFCQLD